MEYLHLGQGDTTHSVRLDLQKSESHTGRNNHHFHVMGTKTYHGEGAQEERGGGEQEVRGMQEVRGGGQKVRGERGESLARHPQPSGIRIPPVIVENTIESGAGSFLQMVLQMAFPETLCLQLGDFKDTQYIIKISDTTHISAYEP